MWLTIFLFSSVLLILWAIHANVKATIRAKIEIIQDLLKFLQNDIDRLAQDVTEESKKMIKIWIIHNVSLTLDKHSIKHKIM